MKTKGLTIIASLFVLLASVMTTGAVAQTPSQMGQKSILEALESPIMGLGMVRIFQSPQIAMRITTPSTALAGARIEGDFAVLEGYRVQMYSGNNNRSRGVASSRAEQVRDAFPDMEVSVEYDAPFWRLRVGAFIDMAEARESMEVLQKEFPAFAKEMYVVRTTIKIPR
ncbi:MAG: SPOR domain-containing protein [Porphyromonas sp.]|nr:SPOR domain-containing protein [Porphyromonas sp.]